MLNIFKQVKAKISWQHMLIKMHPWCVSGCGHSSICGFFGEYTIELPLNCHHSFVSGFEFNFVFEHDHRCNHKMLLYLEKYLKYVFVTTRQILNWHRPIHYKILSNLFEYSFSFSRRMLGCRGRGFNCKLHMKRLFVGILHTSPQIASMYKHGVILEIAVCISTSVTHFIKTMYLYVMQI